MAGVVWLVWCGWCDVAGVVWLVWCGWCGVAGVVWLVWCGWCGVAGVVWLVQPTKTVSTSPTPLPPPQVEGKAVGFMSINSDFDIDILIGLYDLDNFNGLRNCHEDDVVRSVWETDKRFEKQVGKVKNAHEKTITEAVVVIDNDEEEDDEDEDEDENEEEEDSEEEDDAEARLEKEEIKEIEQREEDLDQTSDEEDDEERKEEEEEEEDEEEEEEAEEEEEEIDMEEKVASDELTVVDSLDETQCSARFIPPILFCFYCHLFSIVIHFSYNFVIFHIISKILPSFSFFFHFLFILSNLKPPFFFIFFIFIFNLPHNLHYHTDSTSIKKSDSYVFDSTRGMWTLLRLFF